MIWVALRKTAAPSAVWAAIVDAVSVGAMFQQRCYRPRVAVTWRQDQERVAGAAGDITRYAAINALINVPAAPFRAGSSNFGGR